MPNFSVEEFKSGVHNLTKKDGIPEDAAQDSLNWITIDKHQELARGKVLVGAEGTAGNCKRNHFGYKVDGTPVMWRKAGTKIQYLNGTSWTDTVTGLSASDDYTFSNYQSLAGTFTYATGPGGIFKLHNANPGSYIDLYDVTKNFKGYSTIDKGRMLMWGITKDRTGLYGSRIDGQDSTVYTTVSNESIENGDGVTTTFTGTLAFKAVNAARNAFGLLIKCVGTTLGTFTVTIASPGVFTKTAHGLSIANTVRFSTTGALPTGLSTNTNYYVISAGLTADNFQVSATLNGAAINTSGSQSGTHTLYNTTNGAGQESFTDNYDGTLTGSAGGTGTINYITGAYSVTFVTVPPAGTDNVTADYQYENSNALGITDFTKSATRLAGEGFTLRQDEGGDAIQTVVVGRDGSYYSIKKSNIYRYTPDSTDTAPVNEVFSKDIGILSNRGAVSTGQGIFLVNTVDANRPQLTVLQANPLGGDIFPVVVCPHFAWGNYDYSNAAFETWEGAIVISCMTPDSTVNDRLLLVDPARNTVDITNYGMEHLTKNAGNLYGGSVYTLTTYQLFDGLDDDTFTVENYWIGKDESYDSEKLKKYRRLRVRGNIATNQSTKVYMDYDNSGATLVGTILGTGEYVDTSNPISIGSVGIGANPIGGGEIQEAYPYFIEFKVKVPKFRVRAIKFVTQGYGYFSFEDITDFDILTYEQRIPKKYRVKQNVSLDGTETAMATPEF